MKVSWQNLILYSSHCTTASTIWTWAKQKESFQSKWLTCTLFHWNEYTCSIAFLLINMLFGISGKHHKYLSLNQHPNARLINRSWALYRTDNRFICLLSAFPPLEYLLYENTNFILFTNTSPETKTMVGMY